MNKELTATIIDFDYIPSTPAYVKQGVKGNRTPKGAISGGNGSFVIAGEPPQVIIEVDVTNHQGQDINIYSIIKSYTPRSRVTYRYCKDIYNEIVGNEIVIPEDERVSTYVYQKISELVQEAINELN